MICSHLGSEYIRLHSLVHKSTHTHKHIETLVDIYGLHLNDTRNKSRRRKKMESLKHTYEHMHSTPI